MSASHRRTDIHRRQQRLKKRGKLLGRIAAAPVADRAKLEAKVVKTYSAFHFPVTEKPSPPPPVV